MSKAIGVLPKWIRVCIIVALVASLTSATAMALTSVVVRKPLRVNIIVSEPTLALTSVDFESYYNATTHRYTKCKVTITNTAAGGVNANILVNLRDANNEVIAYGQITVNTPNSNMVVEIPLIWQPNKNIHDFKGGDITVQQLS